MRYLLLCVAIAGCHSTPSDIEIFCSPEAAKHARTLEEFGPWYEPQVRSEEVKKILLDVKESRIAVIEFGAVMANVVADAHITSCPALDLLRRR